MAVTLRTRLCRTCREPKSLDEFYPKRGSCKSCVRARTTAWREANRLAWSVQRRAWERAHPQEIATRCKTERANIKRAVVDGYGGACACCGETEIVFLTIDHIDGSGAAARRAGEQSQLLWRGLLREGFPPGYQILCFNCNWAKSHGGCPHGNAAGQPMTATVVNWP